MFDFATRRRERKGRGRKVVLLGPKKKRGGRGGGWDGVSRWRHFLRCRAYARSLKLKGVKEWQAWCKVPGQRPEDVPSSPERTYAGLGWQGYGDWLGTGNVEHGKKNFRSFEACRAYARSLALSDKRAWKAWSKVPGNRPADVPSRPDQAYKDVGWTNWGDFLGTGNKYGSNQYKK